MDEKEYQENIEAIKENFRKMNEYNEKLKKITEKKEDN